MTRPEGEDGKPILDSTERVLTRRKSNAAAAGETLALGWQEGVFVPIQANAEFGQGSRKDAAEVAFLAALKACDRAVSDNKRAGNWAPRILHMARHGADFRIPELAEAMANLMKREVVGMVKTRRDYKDAFELKALG